MRFGLTSYAAVFGGSITSGGNIIPGTTSKYTLGTSSLYWNNLYTNIATVGNGTDSSGTTSGALIVNGGAGISKKLYVGTNLDVGGTANIKGNTTIGDATSDVHKVNGNMTHNGVVYFANGTTYYINNSGTGYLNALTTNGAVKMNGNTASSSMTTGQLVINGGAGMSGQLNAKSVRIDNAVRFEYNSTDKCVDVIFG